MAKKFKKNGVLQGSRNREKIRRICIRFDKICLFLALVTVASAVLIWNRPYDLATTGAEGFPALFLLVLAFVPIEMFEALCYFLELPEAALFCRRAWAPGCSALFTVAAIWAFVRFYILKRKGASGVKVASTLVKITLFWGIFQLLCFTAASAFDEKEADSVRVHLKHDVEKSSPAKTDGKVKK